MLSVKKANTSAQVFYNDHSKIRVRLPFPYNANDRFDEAFF